MELVRRVRATLSTGAGVAPEVARVVLGYVMAAHGWEKVDGGADLRAGLGAFLDSKSVPLPDLVAWVVPYLELGGGVLLILGLATRWSAAVIAGYLVLAALVVTRTNGLIAPQGGGVGYERDLVYIASALVLVVQGPGRPSVDHLLGLERSEPSARTPQDAPVGA